MFMLGFYISNQNGSEFLTISKTPALNLSGGKISGAAAKST
jgi:hypothetical protein